LPEDSKTPHFEEVYHAIMNTETEKGAQLYLGSKMSYLDGGSEDLEWEDDDGMLEAEAKGRIRGPMIKDQILEAQYDLFIEDIEEHENVEYTSMELVDSPERDVDPTGPGFTANLEFGEAGHHDIVTHSKGSIKLMRVWAKEAAPGEQPMELFEGSFSLEVIYQLKYQKKVGRVENNGSTFWAVRAKKGDDGREIGMRSQAGCRFF
jgi:hypothetical protein